MMHAYSHSADLEAIGRAYFEKRAALEKDALLGTAFKLGLRGIGRGLGAAARGAGWLGKKTFNGTYRLVNGATMWDWKGPKADLGTVAKTAFGGMTLHGLADTSAVKPGFVRQ